MIFLPMSCEYAQDNESNPLHHNHIAILHVIAVETIAST
jgi:hypothetical protein